MALNAVMEPEKISLLKNLTKLGKAIESNQIDLNSVHRMIQEFPSDEYNNDINHLEQNLSRQQKWSEVLQFMQNNPHILI